MKHAANDLERERQQLQEDLAEQFWPALLGELAGPMAHEFNNFLNTLLLEISVLETEIPPNVRAELAIIKRHAAAAARLIKQLQEYRQRRQGELRPVALNQIVRDVTGAWNAGTTERALVVGHAPVNFQLDLAGDLPHVLALPAPLKRLLFFLLKNATDAQMHAREPILIRTRQTAATVQLIVEDSGPPLNPDQLAQMFDLAQVRQGSNALELAACKSIVRRLDGNIRGNNRAQGGVAVVVELPVAGAQK